ncbi:transitional endoplasmic reticulum ATPase [Jiangella alba]|uniref:Transitional endoplasmic reticulum ATPase n=2 Tax=Jiangella alba TaxID=561176 RepID=A0A1H5MXD8_9ACTN|nr:transitional endoplasmic reticulum ATPase [Jiangella alba]
MLRNGYVHTFKTDDDDDTSFEVGDVVLVGPDWYDIEHTSSDLWYSEKWIGVVRLVLDEEIVISTGERSPRSYPRLADLDIEVGYTVEGRDPDGVIRVLDTRPIRQIDLSLDEPTDLSNFKKIKPEEPDEDSPSFDDFGGYRDIVERAVELIEVPLKHHDKLTKINAKGIKGVLFTGPSGTGKTLLAEIIAHRAGATFYLIRGPEIISKYLGDSEDLLRKIFDDAKKNEPAIIFFDEMDSVAPQRGGDSHEASRRLVGQLLTLIDGFDRKKNIMVIATTNRPEDIDSALRRPGRFDWEIAFPLPEESDREEILRISARRLNVDKGLPHEIIAHKTNGWSPAELTAIWSEAALLAVQDHRDIVLEEDYFGGFERVAAQREQVAKSKRRERQEGKR